MTSEKEHAHALIDRVPQAQMSTVVRILESLFLEDEKIGEDEEAAVARAKEWFKHNQGTPFEELVTELGFSMDEIRNGSRSLVD
jgi:hypothetical protein